MSISKLFVKPRRSIGGITMDAVLSEGHSSSLNITNHPVEVGAEISDHAVIQPRELFISGEVTDTPLNLAAFGEIRNNINNLFGTSTNENETRSTQAYQAFEQLQEQRQFIDVQTGLKLYENCLITALAVTQDSDSSRSVSLNLTLRQVILVETQIVNINDTEFKDFQLEASSGARAQGTSTESQGRKELSLPKLSIDKTVTKAFADWIRGQV